MTDISVTDFALTLPHVERFIENDVCTLPPTVQALCQALDTHDRLVLGPLGGAVSAAVIDAVNALAQEFVALGKAG